jgi:hypothetical protein
LKGSSVFVFDSLNRLNRNRVPLGERTSSYHMSLQIKRSRVP